MKTVSVGWSGMMEAERPWTKWARLAAYAVAAVWIVASTLFFLTRFSTGLYKANSGHLKELLERILY